jgi:predicted transcriptional regulator
MQEQFVKMAADIVAANATGRGVSTEQLVEMLKCVGQTLENLSKEPVVEVSPALEEKTAMTWQESITKNSITCLICGFQGTTLNAHIRRKHNLTSKEYCVQFGIPARTALVSKAYSAKRSKMAKESGLGENLKRAREAKKETAAIKPKTTKKSKKETAPVQE